VSDLLEHLTHSQWEPNLETLELTCEFCMDKDDDSLMLMFTVAPFLRSMSKLIILHLCLPLLDWSEVTKAVCTCSETLESVVLHARGWDSVHEQEQDENIDFCGRIFEILLLCNEVGLSMTPAFLVSDS